MKKTIGKKSVPAITVSEDKSKPSSKAGQAQAKRCEAIEGITKEGENIIQETDKGTATRDVGLILAAQKVEHYEISTYGSLVTLAKTIGRDDVADLLHTTLEEEKETGALLTNVAENHVNYEAEAELK